MSVNDCLERYRKSVAEAESFISIAYTQEASGAYIHPELFRSFNVESAVVKFQISWESFLESIFACFLCGDSDLRGNVVTRSVYARDRGHASQLLIGTNKYFDWSNPDIVIKMSKLYLSDNNPFSCTLSSIHSDLLDLKIIRNSAAHLSITTQDKLDGLASRLMGTRKVNCRVSDVILFVDPIQGKSLWNIYKDKLDVAAENIAMGMIV